MIARPAARPHICLRCQRCLAQPFTNSARQHVNPSADATAISETSQETGDSTTKPEAQVRRTLVPLAHYSKRNGRIRGTKQYRPVVEKLGDFYGHSGQKLLKEKESLKIEKFGSPAEVIVLRESKIRRYDHGGRDNMPSQNAEQVDIMSQVAEEQGLIDQDEVEENINTFRPAPGLEPNDRKEFNKLVVQMQDAFTTPQLEHYLDSHIVPNIDSHEDPKINPDKYQLSGMVQLEPYVESQDQSSRPHTRNVASAKPDGLILHQTAWERVWSDFDQSLEHESLRGYTLPSHTTKQRLIIRVLRECWKLELPNMFVKSPIGRVEIKLLPSDLSLLTKSSILDSIKAEFLSDREDRIQGFANSGLVRITSRQRQCQQVIKKIEAALRNIRRLGVNFSNLMPPNPKQKKHTNSQLIRWTEANLDEAALGELGRLTNTYITRRAPKGVTISCLISSVDVWLANRAEMARRLLVAAASPPSGRENYELVCKEVPEPKAKLAKFVPYNAASSLSWRDKLRSWTRWIVPIGKASTERVEEDVLVHRPGPKGPKTKKASKNANKAREAQQRGGDVWDVEYATRSSAILGSVLHNHPDTSKNMPSTPWGTHATRRVFDTSLPSVSNVIKHADIIRKAPIESLVLRFLPNPFQIDPRTNNAVGAGVFSAFPPIEMTFNIHKDTRGLKLSGVDAIVEEGGTDLMLPDHAADVRFQHRTTSRLRAEKLNMVPIKNFLRSSILSAVDRRVDLPATIKMPISRHLCYTPGLAELKMDLGQDIYDVEYLFVDREKRKTMFLTFQDWKMDFTTVDAGKTSDNKTRMIRLRPTKVGSPGSPQEFTAVVYELTKALGTDELINPRRTKADLVAVKRTKMEVPGRRVDRLFTHYAKWFNFNNIVDDNDTEEKKTDEATSATQERTSNALGEEDSYTFMSEEAVDQIAQENAGLHDRGETTDQAQSSQPTSSGDSDNTTHQGHTEARPPQEKTPERALTSEEQSSMDDMMAFLEDQEVASEEKTPEPTKEWKGDEDKEAEWEDDSRKEEERK
ncbi:mitochondrial inner-membrane-bound regulator-domain-containing protein [Halenospora varia]|nr:mitochondrial inner-membrane-bound regulator-domain-containing protein [Halenospora varia]